MICFLVTEYLYKNPLLFREDMRGHARRIVRKRPFQTPPKPFCSFQLRPSIPRPLPLCRIIPRATFGEAVQRPLAWGKAKVTSSHNPKNIITKQQLAAPLQSSSQGSIQNAQAKGADPRKVILHGPEREASFPDCFQIQLATPQILQ